MTTQYTKGLIHLNHGKYALVLYDHDGKRKYKNCDSYQQCMEEYKQIFGVDFAQPIHKRALTDKETEAIILYSEMGMAQKYIAEKINRNESTVASFLERRRRKQKQQVKTDKDLLNTILIMIQSHLEQTK